MMMMFNDQWNQFMNSYLESGHIYTNHENNIIIEVRS